MFKFLKRIFRIKRKWIVYGGFHCGCCGQWENKQFAVRADKSYGKKVDTIGLCDRCKMMKTLNMDCYCDE